MKLRISRIPSSVIGGNVFVTGVYGTCYGGEGGGSSGAVTLGGGSGGNVIHNCTVSNGGSGYGGRGSGAVIALGGGSGGYVVPTWVGADPLWTLSSNKKEQMDTACEVEDILTWMREQLASIKWWHRWF